MVFVTPETVALRHLVEEHRDEITEILESYGASSPRLFGSVARGEATSTSDIDLMVNLDSPRRRLLRLSGLSADLSELLETRVDVVVPELLRAGVSETAMKDAVAL